jgi:hypothetical protein
MLLNTDVSRASLVSIDASRRLFEAFVVWKCPCAECRPEQTTW